jgi:L-lactate dehydrogenase complex protein LldF
LTPQLAELEQGSSLPFASTLCGACYDVCPVKINIPEILAHLRGRVVRHHQQTTARDIRSYDYAESVVMKMMAGVFGERQRYERAQQLARLGQWPFAQKGTISSLPGFMGGWTAMRDLQAVPQQSFRDWWRTRQ